MIPDHMKDLARKGRAMTEAKRTRLTPAECRALRLACIFGSPPDGHPDLDSAKAKLKTIETGGGQ